MKVEVLFTFQNIHEGFFLEKNIIVIDLLRATSTIVTALGNSAKEIIPVESVAEAVKISKNQEKGTYLLAGEKNARMIEGFDLGNSPLEFLDEKVKEKKIILTTTNGTKVFSKLKTAKTIITASLLNLTAASKVIAEGIEDWIILCAGREGIYDASDAICAGALLFKLQNFSNLDLSFNDASKTSLLVFERAKENIANELKKTDHGEFLVRQGFEKDIDFISQVDLYNNVPKFAAGKITL